MAVDQSKVIDIVSKDKTGDFVLTICDHFDWHDTKKGSEQESVREAVFTGVG